MPTLPPNSTSGLYEIDANAIPIGNDVDANNITASGNVTVGGYIIANGSITTNSNFVGNLVGNVTGNITLAGSNTQVVFNDSGVTAGSNAFTFNKTSNTVTIDGTLTTTGNVTGAYFLGNGSQLTGLPATYTDANVVTLLAAFGSNTISTSGNITGGYILGNGSQLTGLPQQYGNANVAAYLASGADTQDIITSGTVQGNRLQTPGAGGNIVGANYISANFYLGDGGLLSNVTSSYGNANVAAYLPTYTGNLNPGNVTATGNISGAYILGNGSQLTGLPASYGNANVAAYLPTYTGNLSPGNLSVTGNTTIGNITVSASRVIDMGLNKITNVGTPVANTDAATKAYVDSQSASGFTIQDDTANTTVVSGGDTLQLLGTANEVTVSITGTDQITFGLPDDVTVTGNITASGQFIGSGAGLTNIPAANISGTVANATYALTANVSNSANSVAGANVTGTVANATYADTANLSNFSTTAFNVSGANVSGTVANATYALTANVSNSANSVAGANVTGTVANATYALNANAATYATTVLGNAQPNITSVGTLSSLDVTGNISGGNLHITDNALIDDDLTVGGTIYGTFAGNISGNLIVPGANTDVLFNNAGNAGASSDFTFNDATNVMTLNGTANVGVLNATGNITGDYIFGNGSGLSSITGANVTGTVANATYALTANVSNSANSVAGANVTGTVANATYALTANAATFAGTVTTAAQPNITSVGNLTSLVVTGNIGAGNITATGNIEAGNLITNNKLLFGTDTPEEYIYADNLTMSFVTNNNTRLSVTSGNAIVYEPLWVTTGNITAASGNVVSSSGVFGATGTFTGNVTAGNVSATNITGTYLIGDGSNITGVVAGSSSTQFSVKNTSGGSLAKGTPVYATGSVGASTTLEVSASRADTTSTMPSIGLLTSTLGVGATGYAISVGTLTQVDTSAYTAGQELYIGATGGITGTRPTGTNLVQPIGSVGRVDATTGSIETNIWNYYQLPNLGNGNVWVGNATGFPTEQVAYGNANVADYLPTYTGNLAGGNLAITANITGGNISTTGIFTASNITANLQVANLLVNNQSVQTTRARDVSVVNSTTTSDPGRIVIGNGLNGNTTPAVDINSAGRSSRLMVSDAINVNENQQRNSETVTLLYATATANISNANTRIIACNNQLGLYGGASGNTFGGTNGTTISALTGTVNVGGGASGALSALGNTTVFAAAGSLNAVLINAGSSMKNSYHTLGISNHQGSTANVGNAIGFTNIFSSTGSGSPYVGNVYAFYNPSNISNFGVTNANVARSAPNYYFLRNDDNVAQAKLGSLRLFHEYRYDTATTGNITIDKNNGQCQFIAPTGNITITGYSNFVTEADDSVNIDEQFDTVTLVIKQGATPYTITLPTGSTYKYAGGVSTVPSTANAVVMISITAMYDLVDEVDLYLTTISPEFT